MQGESKIDVHSNDEKENEDTFDEKYNPKIYMMSLFDQLEKLKFQGLINYEDNITKNKTQNMSHTSRSSAIYRIRTKSVN